MLDNGGLEPGGAEEETVSRHALHPLNPLSCVPRSPWVPMCMSQGMLPQQRSIHDTESCGMSKMIISKCDKTHNCVCGHRTKGDDCNIPTTINGVVPAAGEQLSAEQA